MNLVLHSMVLSLLIGGMIFFIAFTEIIEHQRFVDFCEINGFQNNVSKSSGFASSRDYCIDSNGKLIEVICDNKNCYFLEKQLQELENK